jgi:predicted membrane protein
MWTGITILMVGVAAFIKVSFRELPDWLFSWPMLLIVIGFFMGFKDGFRGIGWFIMILIGGAFLAGNIIPELNLRRYICPVAIIAVGIFLILRPRTRWQSGFVGDKKSWGDSGIEDATIINETKYSKEDFIEATTVFGGVNRNVVSKNFKGGDIVVLFGGSELNFNHADMQQEAVINFTIICGGAKLIVPSNWAVKTELTPIFGGVEDRRSYNATGTPEKILVLKGTVLFGGIDIKSY